jgi:hypothetical protein
MAFTENLSLRRPAMAQMSHWRLAGLRMQVSLTPACLLQAIEHQMGENLSKPGPCNVVEAGLPLRAGRWWSPPVWCGLEAVGRASRTGRMAAE